MLFLEVLQRSCTKCCFATLSHDYIYNDVFAPLLWHMYRCTSVLYIRIDEPMQCRNVRIEWQHVGSCSRTLFDQWLNHCSFSVFSALLVSSTGSCPRGSAVVRASKKMDSILCMEAVWETKNCQTIAPSQLFLEPEPLGTATMLDVVKDCNALVTCNKICSQI